jgi:hypothetical protein
MKEVTELFIGFVIFFLIDRFVRCMSHMRYGNSKDQEISKFELVILLVMFLLGYLYHGRIKI